MSDWMCAYELLLLINVHCYRFGSSPWGNKTSQSACATFHLCTRRVRDGGRCPPRATPPTTSSPWASTQTCRLSTGFVVALLCSASWTHKVAIPKSGIFKPHIYTVINLKTFKCNESIHKTYSSMALLEGSRFFRWQTFFSFVIFWVTFIKWQSGLHYFRSWHWP